MKKIALSFLIIQLLVCSCNDLTQKIEITPTISFNVPQKTVVIKDSTGVVRAWTASFDDDQLKVFEYLMPQRDSQNITTLKREFKKNVEAFMLAFESEIIDSTFTYKQEFLQSNIDFVYKSKDEKYKFFGRFMVNKEIFAVFCFFTPFPIDKYSMNLKDKIFNTIQFK